MMIGCTRVFIFCEVIYRNKLYPDAGCFLALRFCWLYQLFFGMDYKQDHKGFADSLHALPIPHLRLAELADKKPLYGKLQGVHPFKNNQA